MQFKDMMVCLIFHIRAVRYIYIHIKIYIFPFWYGCYGAIQYICTPYPVENGNSRYGFIKSLCWKCLESETHLMAFKITVGWCRWILMRYLATEPQQQCGLEFWKSCTILDRKCVPLPYSSLEDKIPESVKNK